MRIAVLTISDTRTAGDDVSGDRLAALSSEVGTVVLRSVVRDDRSVIEQAIVAAADGGVDLILTTGGTGFGPRDNTPEATSAIIERETPGMAEAMRRETAVKTPMAMLSRGVCGIRGSTLIVNLPGSPKGVEECFEVIRPVLGHAVDQIQGRTRH